MAAATGYGDAPTEEELLAYGDLPRHGRDMAEVFAVRVPAAAAAAGGGGGDRSPPCGTIFFYGGNSCSDLIYSREWSVTDEPAAPQPCPCDSEVPFPSSAALLAFSFSIIHVIRNQLYYLSSRRRIQSIFKRLKGTATRQIRCRSDHQIQFC